MIEIEGLRYRYGEDSAPALEGVSLSVAAGETLLVVGPSGCGKSTLLKCLNGLVPHFHGGVVSGRVRVVGRDPTALGPQAMSETVGFVFQDPETQFVAQRVDDELAFGMENCGLDRATMGRRIEEVLEALAIGHLRRRRVDTLSGGERQRVALGSALTLRPRVLVLDEPTSQLDPRAAADLFELLARLHRRQGLTVVLSEHRLERVARWASRICLLPGPGEPPRVGAPREVLAGSALAPPVTRLGHRLGWRPPPLTVKEARPFATGTVEGRPLAERGSPGLARRSRRGAQIGERAGGGLDLHPGPAEERVPGIPRRRAPEVSESEDRETLLAVRDLTLRYPGAAADAVSYASLDLAAGERVALVGPNGCGKSTLLKGLVGLLKPRRGSVELEGRSTRGLALTEITARVGFVPQNPGRLLFNDTVADEVRFTRRSHGLAPENDEAATAELLAGLGLARHAATYPGDLSTGERQRAALAAILAAGPRVLLLDEPTRGLDAGRKEELAELLAGLAGGGAAVLVATHDVELVARWAGRVIVLEGGRTAADGPAGEVLPRLAGFEPQIYRLLGHPELLTVEAAALALAAPTAGKKEGP